MTDASRLYEALVEAARPIGDREVLELLTVALLARGHVLLEGASDGGPSTVSAAFARTFGLSHQRVRLTPDMERSDLVGGGEPATDAGEDPGRAFSRNVLLAEEINRAPPMVQSTLVEAMEADHLSIRGDPVELPRPFMVVGTLNAVEADEVYGLPASYRAKFLFELQLADLDFEEALELLDRYDQGGIGADAVEPVAGPEDILAARETVRTRHVDATIKKYLLKTILATGEHPDVERGPSTRGAPSLLRAARAFAAVRGREYVIPDDVKAIAVPALAPRLLLTTDAELDDVHPGRVVREAIDGVDPPGTEFEPDVPHAGGREIE